MMRYDLAYVCVRSTGWTDGSTCVRGQTRTNARRGEATSLQTSKQAGNGNVPALERRESSDREGAARCVLFGHEGGVGAARDAWEDRGDVLWFVVC